MKSIVIGLGETGLPLFQVLQDRYKEGVHGYDIKDEELRQEIRPPYDIMNICIGYNPKTFLKAVNRYRVWLRPKLTIIHSTVPVGTTSKIKDAVHSPILGTHGRMKDDILTYTKWVGGEKARKAADYLYEARIKTFTVPTPEETELMKLMCLAKYGMSIAFSVYQKELCDKYGVDYDHVYNWDANYNDGVLPSLKRPSIVPPNDGVIRGHCVLPGTRLLHKMEPNDILKEILRHG